MPRRKIGCTDKLGITLEPDLREAIEREARRRHAGISYTVRTMLRDQLAILMLANADNRQVAS